MTMSEAVTAVMRHGKIAPACVMTVKLAEPALRAGNRAVTGPGLKSIIGGHRHQMTVLGDQPMRSGPDHPGSEMRAEMKRGTEKPEGAEVEKVQAPEVTTARKVKVRAKGSQKVSTDALLPVYWLAHILARALKLTKNSWHRFKRESKAETDALEKWKETGR